VEEPDQTGGSATPTPRVPPRISEITDPESNVGGSGLRPARAQDGAHRQPHHDHAPGGRTHPRRTSSRRRGRRPQDRARRPGQRSTRDRGGRDRTRPRRVGRTRWRTPRTRETFGVPIIDHQDVAFLLADMEAAVSIGSLDAAARRSPARSRTCRSGREASSGEDWSAPTMRCEVTTDAVQVFGELWLHQATSPSNASCVKPR
jgi:hypothetical protein